MQNRTSHIGALHKRDPGFYEAVSENSCLFGYMCLGNSLEQVWGSGEATCVLVWYLEVLLKQYRGRFIYGFAQTTRGWRCLGSTTSCAVVGSLLGTAHPSGGMPWGASLSLLWGRQTTLLSLRPSQGGGATD